ncbi:MAG TPA: GWxTD domain-containing protein [Candidatus Polarisedimenticolia bacterium]|nr:GWxTD domain-containing protein [Candidatus Polarisedimenticolia bacterium]
MSIRRAFIILAGVLCACQILLAADLRQQWDQPNRKWIKGPVRCLLTPEEEKQFKALKTDEEISAFVKAFWAHRDPTPGTPENEFADLFWKRVAEAERLFPQTTEPGAISDRGQVYLLLGRATKTPNPGKTMDWVYENVPYVTPSTFTVQFSTGSGGNPLLLGRKGFEQIIAANEFLRGLGPKAAELYAPKPKPQEMPAAIEMAPPAEVATEESKILDDNALNDALPSAVPFQVRTDFYQATKGDSFVVLTFAVARKDAGGAPLVVFARMVPYASDMKPITLAAANSFGPAEPENSDPNSVWLTFQAGVGAHPGRYSLLAGVRDPATGKLGMVRQPFEVPSYSSQSLQLSTVVLSSALRGPEASPPAAEGKVAPFYLGSFRIVPALDNTFHQGGSMAWYYQIYNAAPDPATGKPNLTLQYEFSLLQKGEYHPVTAPQVVKNRSSQVEAFSFQLVKPTATQKGWVEGDYKLLIKVSDEVSKNSAPPIEIPFKVVP